jgi:predicted component of type VI protein secretion system
MAQYRFVMRSGPVVGKVFPLEAQEIYIGREPTNMIVINDIQVSRRHAKMELRGSAYLVQDLGSTNGTFVNGRRLSGTQALNPGDTVELGESIVLAYELVKDLNATMVSTEHHHAPVQEEPTQAPSPAPVPAPAPFSLPAPTPLYSGQVPAGPVPSSPVPAAPAATDSVPMPPESVKPRRKFPVWIIILIILFVIICACVGFFLVIDQLRLWCKVVPLLVPLLGGTCP